MRVCAGDCKLMGMLEVYPVKDLNIERRSFFVGFVGFGELGNAQERQSRPDRRPVNLS